MIKLYLKLEFVCNTIFKTMKTCSHVVHSMYWFDDWKGCCSHNKGVVFTLYMLLVTCCLVWLSLFGLNCIVTLTIFLSHLQLIGWSLLYLHNSENIRIIILRRLENFVDEKQIFQNFFFPCYLNFSNYVIGNISFLATENP